MNDWIEWGGGKCPVPKGTLVDVEYRNGQTRYRVPALASEAVLEMLGESVAGAGCTFWKNDEIGYDIIRYRLSEPSTTTDTERRIAALEREVAALKGQKQEQWEPEGGEWFVEGDGDVGSLHTEESFRQFGAERKTQDLAHRAAVAMRRHNRALAYVHEHAPEWDGEDPWFVAKAEINYYPDRAGFHRLGLVTGPEHVMRQLADDLNSGRVVL